MKVVSSLRAKYMELNELASILKNEIDGLLYAPCNKNEWFYRSRIKSEDSFSLKCEVNSFYTPDKADDFFGCEIVVTSSAEIEKVKEVLREKNISIEFQRPEDLTLTHLSPNDFNFSELRLYCKKQARDVAETGPLHQFVFEVQVKTIFSFAWTKATHDLIYKTDRVSWSKSRVAYQIKASLEQAEYQVSTISNTVSDFFPTNEKFERLNSMIDILNQNWLPSFLPGDMKRLAENVDELLKLVNFPIDSFKALVEANKEKHSNLSPYLKVVQLLNDHRRDLFLKIPEKRRKFDLLIPSTAELELDKDVIAHLKKTGRLKELS